MTLKEYSFIFFIRYLQNRDPNTINFAIEQNNTTVFKSAPQTGVKLNWNKQRIVLDSEQPFSVIILKNEHITVGQANATIDTIEMDNKIEFQNLEQDINQANFNAYIYTTLYEATETVNRPVASQIVR